MAQSFRGYPACSCLILWLPVFEAALKARGIVSGLRIYQLIGGAAASAGTHSQGGAFDIQTLPAAGLRLARDMGADATWNRTTAQGFNSNHCHGVLRGCPHNAPARYQLAAVDAGYSGLGSGGRGSRDDGPRPLSGRTWQQGIEWAQAQMEDDMPSAREIAAEVWLLGHRELGGNARDWLASLPWRVWTVSHKALGGRTAYEAMATTEAKIDAVIEAIKGIEGVDPAEVERVVRDGVAAALASVETTVTVRPASEELQP